MVRPASQDEPSLPRSLHEVDVQWATGWQNLPSEACLVALVLDVPVQVAGGLDGCPISIATAKTNSQ